MTINLLANTYPSLTLIFVALLGACMGSFAALIIYRWPRDMSIISPGSFCQACQKKIKPWHNIPIISWLLLRGRCSYCRTFYGLRVLIIEVIFMTALLAIYLKFGLSFVSLEKFGMVFLLVCLAYIDLDTYTLPMSMLILLILWGLLFSAFYYYYPVFYIPMGETYGLLKYLVLKIPLKILPDRLLGGIIGFLFFALINLGATAILRATHRLSSQQWAMGWGDPWLLAAIALFVGLSHLVLVIFLASVAGSVAGIINLLLIKKPEIKDEDIAPGALPYGPFLAMAAIYVYLF